jgi:[acyl-carrier-protein] S-malonyltransferase
MHLHDAPLAILFPGQGSQEPNMGRDLAEASSEAMDLWKRAEKACGAALREIYWDGDEAAMSETRYLQPALTAVDISFWRHMAPHLSPACAAGHSLGEFSALAAAGVLPAETVLELTALRGRLMAEADPEGAGAMAAVLKLDLAQVEELVEEARARSERELLIANYNSPAQYVVSGHAQAVEAIAPLVKARKGRAVPLAVSGAFHSPLMAEAAKELAGYMDKLSWSAPRFPVVCNVTGEAEQDPQAIHALMARQMTSSVRWIETVQTQWAMGVRRWLELGPKGVLAKLLAANLKGRDEEWEAASAGSLEGADALIQE